jgi:hypothetical protein
MLRRRRVLQPLTRRIFFCFRWRYQNSCSYLRSFHHSVDSSVSKSCQHPICRLVTILTFKICNLLRSIWGVLEHKESIQSIERQYESEAVDHFVAYMLHEANKCDQNRRTGMMGGWCCRLSGFFDRSRRTRGNRIFRGVLAALKDEDEKKAKPGNDATHACSTEENKKKTGRFFSACDFCSASFS